VYFRITGDVLYERCGEEWKKDNGEKIESKWAGGAAGGETMWRGWSLKR